MSLSEILGTSSVSKKNKITLISKVSKILGIAEGDTIVFYQESTEEENNKNRIYIEGGLQNAR